MSTHDTSAGNTSAHDRLLRSLGITVGCPINMCIHSNERGELDYHGLPTLISNREETLAIIASLPPGVEVHYMVMLPRNPQDSQYADLRVREDVNRKKIKAAKKDPSKAQFRDQYYARHRDRIHLLNDMIHVGNHVMLAPENQAL
ncbi:hypothetical protein CIB48_g2532 [Xylaria polymorpha]|nr:hypothetical protein CIB48_g2532 [Xylaria polymorpha]